MVRLGIYYAWESDRGLGGDETVVVWIPWFRVGKCFGNRGDVAEGGEAWGWFIDSLSK